MSTVGRVRPLTRTSTTAPSKALACLDVPAFSVQYHPEAAPGPHDARYLFDEFIELMGLSPMSVRVWFWVLGSVYRTLDHAARRSGFQPKTHYPRPITGGPVPKRQDLHSILLIGSGPIVIGQACEFDYSGTQAAKVLRSEGYRVVLVNSNPATIMTDPEFADATYIEPIIPEVVARIIERERPDALLPTLGGQTALNCTVDLASRECSTSTGSRCSAPASTLSTPPRTGAGSSR